MKAEILSRFPHIWLSCIGLLLFVGVFLGALGWVFRKGSREFYSALSRGPLELKQQEEGKQ
jgi:cbb3-type cytochrome oxidase subunit 3